MKFLSNSIFTATLHSASVVKLLFMVTLIIFTPLLVGNSLTTNEAFASSSFEKLRWQLVFISNYPACSNYQHQMLNTYFEIAHDYLTLYNVGNSVYNPLCLPIDKYFSEYESPPGLDLIIIVYDKDLGMEELHSQKIGGFYHHIGKDDLTNHAIILCDCPTFNYSNPIWILTHELSHFVLTYRGYDMSIIEDLVHSNDEKYDQCMENWEDSCESVATKIWIESRAYSYSVMPIYTPATNATGIDEKSYVVPDAVIDISKIISEWWISGKITDNDYANVLGFVGYGKGNYSDINSEILTADKALDDQVTWEELLLDNTEKEYRDILFPIPYIQQWELKMEYEQEDKEEIPQWYKETVAWWLEGKIPNEDFVRYVDFLNEEGFIPSQ